ncbi:minor tail protein [Mycobacterium phage WXIN]|nr:minor tail protein [Mycobacterium phage WXIN]
MEVWPPTVIPKRGIELLREGIEPLITYTSPDNDVQFHINGGLAPFPGVTEGVILTEGMSGMHASFSHLDHRGARQDGATWADTVYDPAEMLLRVTITARTPETFRKLVRRWFAAWDPERPGKLSWTTPEGTWWCFVRLFRTPPEKLESGYSRVCKQTFTWSIRNDDAFWRSVDSVSQFRFAFNSISDGFNRNDVGDLGDNWEQTYTGLGGGVCESEPELNIFWPGRAVWKPSGNHRRTVVNRHITPTATDNQVVTIQIGEFFQFPFPDASYLDVWARLNDNDASPTGIRLRIGPQWIILSRFTAGVETVIKQRILLLAPVWREEWTLIAGSSSNPRDFTVLRGGFPILTAKDTTSAVGASNRYVGFGMEAGEGLFTQMVPPSVLGFTAGDNATVTQSGHLTVTNFGDQPGSPDLVVYGPGTFKLGNGAEVEPTIEFGPLVDGQIALIKTAPGMRAVYDLTTDPVEQDLPFFQDFLQRLVSLVFNNNVPPLFEWFESLFGIRPPQGNLYSLLKGRWTRTISARPVASPPAAQRITVTVEGGNANTKVIAALTPRRRWPE